MCQVICMRKLILALVLFFIVVLQPIAEGKIRWYRTQIDTGQVGNCGPATAAMVATWKKDKPITVEEVRKIIGLPYVEGDTSFEDLEYALNRLKVDNEVKWIRRISDIEKELKEGSLVIVCFFPKYIPRSKSESAYGRGYGTFDGGHYSVIFDSLSDYFVVNDPLPNGEFRFYNKSLIFKSLVIKKILVVSREVKWN